MFAVSATNVVNLPELFVVCPIAVPSILPPSILAAAKNDVPLLVISPVNDPIKLLALNVSLTVHLLLVSSQNNCFDPAGL